MLEALENDSANAASWTLYYQTLPSAGPAPATINCLDNLNYVYFTAGITFSSRGTSNCNITFSAIAGSVGEIYEGTFSGTVQNSGVIRTVTNGRFRVPRTM